jgi:hypothetical protein
MKTVNRKFDSAINSIHKRHLQAGRGRLLRITVLAICSALALPGIALAKKPVAESPAGCVMFPPTIYTGFPFTVKVVRDPAYPGVWSQPTVEVTAVFTKTDGSGEITHTYSETIQRYGVTYINATLTAPSNFRCDDDGDCSEVGIDSLADLSAIVKEPLNKKGNKFRETICTPLNATVNMSN